MLTTPPQRVLLLGGTSEIGLATVRELAAAGPLTAVLAGRDPAALHAAAETLPCTTETEHFEALGVDDHGPLLDRVWSAGPVDVVLVAFGILGDQQRAEREPLHAVNVLAVDLVAQASVLLQAAARMRSQGCGTLVAFSSVAAVRPRRANYVYGAAKAGLDAFARGLADRLHGSGVAVVLVRPGFVVGRMTAGMAPAPFATTTAGVGRATARAVLAGRSAVVWVPPVLGLVAVLMRALPRRVWRRLPR